MSSEDLRDLATQTLVVLGDRTLSVAESLTGGLISAVLTEVPGASHSFRGAVVSYASDLKISILGVDADVIATGGAVQARVALEMARGVCAHLKTNFGLAATGVAGPAPQDGRAPGTVFVAVVECSGNGEITGSIVRSLVINVDAVAMQLQRAYIRNYTVEYGLNLLKLMASGQVTE
jgi:nicotinamide-nucleotide amidase